MLRVNGTNKKSANAEIFAEPRGELTGSDSADLEAHLLRHADMDSRAASRKMTPMREGNAEMAGRR